MMRFFWRIFLKFKGWKIAGDYPYHLKKYIVIVAPHTSNWDFIMGLAVRSVLKLKTRYLGKKELFRFPFGFLFKALGGYPVDRSRSHNMVDLVVDIFNRHEEFSIAIAPEGTRGKVDRLKTGFYHIAHKARIPILMAAMDYSHKKVIFGDYFTPSGDWETDRLKILEFYRPIKGKYPEQGISHLH